MTDNKIENLIASMKGLAGSGGVLGQSIKAATDFLRTLDPGDIVRSDPKTAVAAPIAKDAWYLINNMNLLAKYFTEEGVTFDGDYYDYTAYMAQSLGFLDILPGLKPLKVLRNIEQLVTNVETDVFGGLWRAEYENNGIYWINTMAFELWTNGLGPWFTSKGPDNGEFNNDNYVGYLTFPVGQIGVMEVISLIQETGLSGYKFTAVDELEEYWPKEALNEDDLLESDKPTIQSTPEVFPDMKDANGNALAGQNLCYGRHLIESAYVIPDVSVPSQNSNNSSGYTAYAPNAKLDVELFSSEMKEYGEDVKPKAWMRYWIHKDSTLPVPGEFMGILCRPVAAPPHVWWFQESSPFVYAGNWVEVNNLTSGIVTAVTLEAERSDGGIGNQYTVKIQGCEVIIDSTDFFTYGIGDRVAVLLVGSTVKSATYAFTWSFQNALKQSDEGTAKTIYVIIPATFFKIKT